MKIKDIMDQRKNSQNQKPNSLWQFEDGSTSKPQFTWSRSRTQFWLQTDVSMTARKKKTEVELLFQIYLFQ